MKRIPEYLVRGILWLFSKLPLKVHLFNSGLLRWIAEDVMKYRKAVIYSNISNAFPDMSEEQVKKTAHEFYVNFADILAEAIWFGGCNHKRLSRANVVTCKNPECLRDLFDNSPSVMILCSHSGNWELLGGLPFYKKSDGSPVYAGVETDFCVIYRALSSKMWDNIMKTNRSAPILDPKHYEGYLESRRVVRYAYTHRDQKRYYMMISDQKPYYVGSDNMVINFMGRECTTMSATATIAHKFGYAVCHQTMRRTSRGHYELEYTVISKDASKDDPQRIMQEYYRLLEEDIRQQPFNYLWSHNRWAK